jgi:hypothetical protein
MTSFFTYCGKAAAKVQAMAPPQSWATRMQDLSARSAQQVFDQLLQVLQQRLDAVGIDALGLVRQVVAAQVEGHGAVVPAEFLELAFPAYQNSGKPWTKSISGASAAPSATQCRRMPLGSAAWKCSISP